MANSPNSIQAVSAALHLSCACADGMQEVSGSSPLSSTGFVRMLDE